MKIFLRLIVIFPRNGIHRSLSEKSVPYLVYGLLQLNGGLHGVQGGSPDVLAGFGDVLEDNGSSPLVLVLHEHGAVLAFLQRTLLEELGETGKGLVVAVEVEALEGGREEEEKKALKIVKRKKSKAVVSLTVSKTYLFMRNVTGPINRHSLLEQPTLRTP